MHTNHYQFWPRRQAKSLTIPNITLYDNLVMSAKKYPDKTAVHFYGGTLTYKQIMEEAEKLAGYLENELNVKQNDKVLLFMQNSPQFLISFLLYCVCEQLWFPPTL